MHAYVYAYVHICMYAYVHVCQLDALPLLQHGGRWAPFDVVECTGVLHHLPRPEEGLRVLSALLKPGGMMRLAL